MSESLLFVIVSPLMSAHVSPAGSDHLAGTPADDPFRFFANVATEREALRGERYIEDELAAVAASLASIGLRVVSGSSRRVGEKGTASSSAPLKSRKPRLFTRRSSNNTL